MSKVILVFVALLLCGCGRFDRWWAGTTGRPVETCYKGISYLQFTSGSSVKYNKDGTIAKCEE